MDVILLPLFQVLLVAIDLYVWVLIISAVMSWLVALNIMNDRSRFIYTVRDILDRLTEPLLRPIRTRLPIVGGLDLSPIVLILGLYFIEGVLRRLMFRMM